MKNVYVLMGCVFTVVCWAQDPPTPIRSIFENLPNGHHVLSKGALSKDQRDLDERSTQIRTGYLVVRVQPEYLAQLDDIDLKNWLQRRRHDNQLSLGASKLLGRFREGPNRVSFVFGEGERANAMFTTWHFEADGASLVTLEENQNQKIGKVPATLSLATADKSISCLWKVFAVEEGIAYELVLRDEIDANGLPKLSAAKIMAIAAELVRSAKTGTLEE